MSAEGQIFLCLFPLKSLLTGEPLCRALGIQWTVSALTGLSAQERGQLNKREEGLVGGASDKALLRGFM